MTDLLLSKVRHNKNLKISHS